MTHTFEQLSAMSQEQLDEVKQQKLNELAEINQKRWDTIGAILFYQAEIEKVLS
jgi:hypothetical protein